MTKFPVTGKDKAGNEVLLFPTKGDMSVRIVGQVVTHFSHHAKALERFKELTGSVPAGIAAQYVKTKDWKNSQGDGHECDWEWMRPDDPVDRSMSCTLCGAEAEAADDEEEEEVE